MTIGGRRFLLSVAILAASVCLALGITQPILKLTKLVFWESQHSLASTVLILFQDSQYFLGSIILLFSIVFPILKLLYLLLLSTLSREEIARRSRQLRALEWLGKWSMHDVLVLALTIFFIKSQGVYDATSLNGVYFFTAAVILMILAYAWLRSSAAKVHAQPAPVPRKPSGLRNFVLSFFIIVATVLFVLGVIQPVIRFTTVFVWTDEHSIATIIWALYQNDELFLCAVLFIFSMLFPFLKLFYLLTLMTSPDLTPEFRAKSVSTMEFLGRYSMTDVMVLALMIFYVNSLGYTEASVLPGAYYFAASTIMTMLAYGWANSGPMMTAPSEPVAAAADGPALTRLSQSRADARLAAPEDAQPRQ